MTRRLPLLVALAVLAAAPAAHAQNKDKKKKDKEQPAEAAPPAEPAGPTPEQQQAVVEFQKGQELQTAGDLDGAIAQYEKAFATYPDPELQFLLGEVHRLKGERDSDPTLYEKAIPYFEKYLAMAPDGRAAEAARQRITALEQGIENEKKRKEQEAAEDAKSAAAEAEAKRKADEQARIAVEGHQGAQLALDISLTAGTEKDFTGMARAMAGGLLGWGKFAFEGHIGFAGFLQVADKGIAAREITLLDLGARYAFTSDRFIGPFVGLGGSFGLVTGSPHERKLEDDPDTCAGFTSDDCAFEIDKDLTTRLMLGYGFSSSEKTTVAVRLDLSYMMFSVAGDQRMGSPPASRVEKPQTMLAFLVGLEFMHWP